MQGPREPWKSIFEYGNKQTWINTFCDENCKVYLIEGKNYKIWYKIESIVEDLRWNRNGVLAFALLKLIILVFDLFMSKRVKNLKVQKRIDKGIVYINYNYPDMVFLTRYKIYLAIQHFLNTEHSHMILLTNSSYYDYYRLQEVLKKNNKTIHYGGSLVETNDDSFISGSSRIISKSFAQLIYSNFKEWDRFSPEDVGLGAFAKKYKIHPTHLPLINFSSIEQVDCFFNKNSKPDIFQYRVKSSIDINQKINTTKFYQADAPRNDVNLMLKIHEFLVN